MSDQQLEEELRKPVIQTFNTRKVHSSLIDNIWGADLANIQLISKFNKKNSIFHYVLLISLVNAHGLFL